MAMFRKKKKKKMATCPLSLANPNCKGIDGELCRFVLRPLSYATRQGCIQLDNNYECMPYPGGEYLM